MNEPFLQAFRAPKLIAELVAAEMPLSAVLRQGDHERFGKPWRLVYLGDPLYQLTSSSSLSVWNRLTPESGPKLIPGEKSPTAREITSTVLAVGPPASESDRLQWCLSAAIAELCHSGSVGKSPRNDVEMPANFPLWRSVLVSIDRRQLEPINRPVLDELVIDTLLHSHPEDQLQLQAWLARIPPDQRRPRVWMTLEWLAMSRLASLASEGQLAPALDLWEGVMRSPWPARSEFPTQFTERLTAMVAGSPHNLPPYHVRLTHALQSFAGIAEYPQAGLIRHELERVENLLGMSPKRR